MSHKLFILLLTALVFVSCKKDKPEDYDIPTTYSFENVNYSGQTQRLDMLEELTALMKTGNTQGITVDAQAMKDMFSNESNPFSDAALNSSGKQLKNKTFSLDADTYEDWMDQLATASQSSVAGSNGVAGVVSNGSSSYLFDENGFEMTQLIEKGLMGACFFYQISTIYLGEDKIGEAVDNENITVGEGTDMEHHWDEAFGYFGVPVDFPTNTDGVRFIGNYCNGRNTVLTTLSQDAMTAYLTGRAAISNDDMDTKNAQIPIIREKLELVFASTAIHYLNDAKANISDDAKRNHVLSEAYAFTKGLKYNPDRKISDAQIQSVLDAMGNNFYEVTLSGLDEARNTLSGIYSLDSVKDQL